MGDYLICPTAKCIRPATAPHPCPLALAGGVETECACCGTCARGCETFVTTGTPIQPPPWTRDQGCSCGSGGCGTCGTKVASACSGAT